MDLITLTEAKEYLRVDTSDEDGIIESLLQAATNLCINVARLSGEEWKEDETIRETMRVAILYSLAYLFEHRENADHHSLTLTLRSILFAIREGVV